jgi:transcriptional regulator
VARSTDSLQGTLDLLILKTLERGSNHGFGVTLHIQEVSAGLLRVEEGSLYPALHRLERDGLVTSGWRVTDNGRRARYYSLTAAGRRRLSDAEENWRSLSRGVAKVLRFV